MIRPYAFHKFVFIEPSLATKLVPSLATKLVPSLATKLVHVSCTKVTVWQYDVLVINVHQGHGVEKSMKNLWKQKKTRLKFLSPTLNLPEHSLRNALHLFKALHLVEALLLVRVLHFVEALLLVRVLHFVEALLLVDTLSKRLKVTRDHWMFQ